MGLHYRRGLVRGHSARAGVIIDGVCVRFSIISETHRPSAPKIIHQVRDGVFDIELN